MSEFNKTIHIISLMVTLSTLWLVLSGHYTFLLLGLGAISVLLVLAISLRMGLIEYDDLDVLRQILGFVPYSFWLLKEIFKSSIDVCKRILNPQRPIDPGIIWVKSTQGNDLARTVYANSITLTPGTISIDVENENIEVHFLSEVGVKGLQTGEMDRRVTAAEEKA